MSERGAGLNLAVVEEAAEAWARAAKFVRSRPGRGETFEGASADEIIEGVASFADYRALYLAYERAARRRAEEVGAKKGRPGRRTRLSTIEQERIIALLGQGVRPSEVARRTGRSVRIISRLRQAVA